MKKTVLLILVLLLTEMIGGSTRPVEAGGTIYIMSDGSVSPSTANITSIDNVTYTFTNNNYGSVVVQRDNIVVNGNCFTLEGKRVWYSKGINLTGRRNVTIKNMEIKEFFFGIWLKMSSGNTISGNNITVNKGGVWLSWSSKNTISGNNIASNMDYDIYLEYSSNNSISGNNITAKGKAWEVYLFYSFFGIYLYYSSGNSISENSMINNDCGIELFSSSNNNISENEVANNTYGILLSKSSNNTIYGNDLTINDRGIVLTSSSNNTIHQNNFVNNTKQVHNYNSTNVWYCRAGKGNYWSDYERRYPDAGEKDEPGIWDTPYILDENNEDYYPLVNPWTPKVEETLPTEVEQEVPLWMQWWFWATVSVGIAALAGAVYFSKKRYLRKFS